MKLIFGFFFLFFFLLGIKAQEVPDTSTHVKIYIVEKNDGSEYIGKIISKDEREVLIETKNLGRIYIPMHEIKSINEIKDVKLTKEGDLITDELFATRYFLTTNGLPSKKGDSYIQWNLYGPDFQFGVSENLNIGIMTSWFGVPIVGNIRYSKPVADNFSIGLGGLLGTGSWAKMDGGLALPFLSLTFGTKQSNLSFSSGYGIVFDKSGNSSSVLFSVAGLTKVSPKLSLVFDSFIVPNNINDVNGFAILIPGIRWQTDSRRAFQFGFAGIIANNELAPFPFPMIQWYRKL